MHADVEIVNRALQLPSEGRAELARRLILSLEPGDFDEDVERQWEAEIETRLKQLERGEITPTDWRESIERAPTVLRGNAKP